MERQAGLGRSLEDVLDSLTPAGHEPQLPGRVLFEPEDLEQQLDQLMGDIRDLRERVQHLVGLIPNRVVLEPVRPLADEPPISISPADADAEKHEKKKKKHKSKTKKTKNKKAKAEHREHAVQAPLPTLRGVSGA
jgi:hypothetical protein